MAIAYVNKGTYGGDNFGTDTLSLDLGSASDRYILVFAISTDGGSIGTATVDGASLTELQSETESYSSRNFKLFGGTVSATGTKDVVVPTSGSYSMAFQAVVYSGVGSLRSSAKLYTYGASPGFSSVTTESGDLLVMLGNAVFSGVAVAGTGATLLWPGNTDPTYISGYIASCTELATGASTTIDITWNGGGSDYWEGAMGVLVPASAASVNHRRLMMGIG